MVEPPGRRCGSWPPSHVALRFSGFFLAIWVGGERERPRRQRRTLMMLLLLLRPPAAPRGSASYGVMENRRH